MIKVKTLHTEQVIKPTIFPDGTSQVWKLHPSLLDRKDYYITWNFESEREIVDLYSLMYLLPADAFKHLHIPYLPFGRQDKDISNDATFNLAVFAELINGLMLNQVSTVDAHNPYKARKLINNFKNITNFSVCEKVVEQFAPTFIVFPDKGAMDRYRDTKLATKLIGEAIYCEKVRNQATGDITGTKVHLNSKRALVSGDRLLIIDDICDGGATFIGVAKALREYNSDMTIALFVTHGIFSKGRQHLIDNGINEIFTTNSLIKNTDGYEV